MSSFLGRNVFEGPSEVEVSQRTKNKELIELIKNGLYSYLEHHIDEKP